MNIYIIVCLTSCRTCIIWPKTLYIKPCAVIFTYFAENVFEVLNCHHQELTHDNPLVIQKQRALEEAEEPESEPHERTVMVLILTEGRGLLEGV